MGCLGVHFSLSEDVVQTIRSIEDEAERAAWVREDLEDEYFDEHRDWLAPSAKAWDAMHRALADGQLAWGGGEYPLNHVVLGGEMMYTPSDYIMMLKTPQQVRDVAAALPAITEDDFRKRYFAIDAASYGCPLTDDDFGYTWDAFQRVRDFWLRAATEGRYVLFTADQ